MARNARVKKHIRKLTKGSRGSMYIVLPLEMIRERKWRPRQTLVVQATKKGILIADYDPKKDT